MHAVKIYLWRCQHPLVTNMGFLHTLQHIILDRKAQPVPESYTARLLAEGEDEIMKKIGEEAMELILAAKGQGNQRVISETADLFYHILVMLAERNLSLAEVEAELERRHQ